MMEGIIEMTDSLCNIFPRNGSLFETRTEAEFPVSSIQSHSILILLSISFFSARVAITLTGWVRTLFLLYLQFALSGKPALLCYVNLIK